MHLDLVGCCTKFLVHLKLARIYLPKTVDLSCSTSLCTTGVLFHETCIKDIIAVECGAKPFRMRPVSGMSHPLQHKMPQPNLPSRHVGDISIAG
jgi:hypothetical protein